MFRPSRLFVTICIFNHIYQCYLIKKVGGVLKSMLTLNEAIIDVKEG